MSTRNISSESMHAFLSNFANRQTDIHTNKHGQKHVLPPLSEVKWSSKLQIWWVCKSHATAISFRSHAVKWTRSWNCAGSDGRISYRLSDNGSGTVPLNSPGDSTLQWGAGEICCARHDLVTIFSGDCYCCQKQLNLPWHTEARRYRPRYQFDYRTLAESS